VHKVKKQDIINSLLLEINISGFHMNNILENEYILINNIISD